MTIHQLHKKSSELIDSINAMLVEGINFDRLDEILNEAKKLESIGRYTEAKRIMGMIAAINGDAAEVDRHFNAAVASSGRDALVILNYATALGNIHHHVRAIEVVGEAVERAPDDLGILNPALSIYIEAYDIDEARRLQEHLAKLGQPNRDAMLNTKLAAIADMLATSGATWTQVSERIELASDTLRKQGLTSRIGSEELCDGVVLYEFNLEADVATATRAENAIHHAIAAQPYSPADRFISFSCVPQ